MSPTTTTLPHPPRPPLTPDPPHPTAPSPSPPSPSATPAAQPPPETYEQAHVHSVYEAIAPHFSQTRYKPWPLVTSFLHSLPPYSLGLDVGCGNGKNIPLAPASSRPSPPAERSQAPSSLSHAIPPPAPPLFTLASDRSLALTTLASSRCTSTPHADALLADALAPPHHRGRFDFAISIAVIHHFSNAERRIRAVEAVLGVLRTGRFVAGKELPWRQQGQREGNDAGVDVDDQSGGEEGTKKEEEGKGKQRRRWTGGKALIYVWALEQATSRRGWGGSGKDGEEDDQDVMVPWVLTPQKAKLKPKSRGNGTAGEKREGDRSAEGEADGQGEATNGGDRGPTTFERYYHLYRKGELEADVLAAGGVVLDAGYEKDNWWAVVGRPDDVHM